MNIERFIHSFTVVKPLHHLSQAQIVAWTLKAHERVERLKGTLDESPQFARLLGRFALSEKFIQERYFECGEVDENWEQHEIYRISFAHLQGAGLEERNLFFGRRATEVFKTLYGDTSPAHLVHVTCTGYLSPSPAQNYFSDKKSPPSITHAYHMGCYASLPAVRMAQGLSLSEESTVDIVHNEMCSLHFNPTLHTPEQMVVQSLFADGHIRYSVGGEAKGFKILCIHEKLIPNSQSDMTWIPASHGMKMTLSREVPFKIRDGLPAFLNEICHKAGVDKFEILKHAIFAIHPGGPKIIEAVQIKLELQDHQVQLSHKVLFERGNMSSATLPHVWNEILESRPLKGTKVLSLAFGPGLTIFGALFEVNQ
jgi:predicted naringenin-chalcone synthase